MRVWLRGRPEQAQRLASLVLNGKIRGAAPSSAAPRQLHRWLRRRPAAAAAAASGNPGWPACPACCRCSSPCTQRIAAGRRNLPVSLRACVAGRRPRARAPPRSPASTSFSSECCSFAMHAFMHAKLPAWSLQVHAGSAVAVPRRTQHLDEGRCPSCAACKPLLAGTAAATCRCGPWALRCPRRSFLLPAATLLPTFPIPLYHTAPGCARTRTAAAHCPLPRTTRLAASSATCRRAWPPPHPRERWCSAQHGPALRLLAEAACLPSPLRCPARSWQVLHLLPSI